MVLDIRRRRLIWFGGWPPKHDSPVDDLYVLDLSGPSPGEWEYVEHQHPDFLARSPSGRTATVYTSDDGSEVIDLLLVTSLEDRDGKPRNA